MSTHFSRAVTTAVLALAVGFSPLAAAPGALADTATPASHSSIQYTRLPRVVGVKPTITGNAWLNSTLTAVPGTWAEGVTLTYKWYRNSHRIAGATSDTYLVTKADLGRRITVAVKGSAEGFRSTTRVSSRTATVVKPPLTSVKPVVVGDAWIDSVLTADPGAWGPEGVVLTYQWYRGSKAIKGAKASTYTVVSKDKGRTLKVKVTGKLADYATKSLTSVATAKVTVKPVPPLLDLTDTPIPVILCDTPSVIGSVFSVETGLWGPGDVQLSYQWYIGGDLIEGATGATYTSLPGDSGGYLTVKVTGTEDGYNTVTKESFEISVGEIR